MYYIICLYGTASYGPNIHQIQIEWTEKCYLVD